MFLYRKSESPRPDRCDVCHMKAFGYNYEVVSCNACKMFFRRSISNNTTYKCKYDGKCFIDLDKKKSRPKCRACRLQLCISLGMRTSSSNMKSSDKEKKTENIYTTIITDDMNNSAKLSKLSYLYNLYTKIYPKLIQPADITFADIIIRDYTISNLMENQNIDWGKTVYQYKPWASLGIELTIEICKLMDFYNKLLISDRLVLMKGVAMKSYALQASFDSYFSRNSETATSPDNQELYPMFLRNYVDVKFLINSRRGMISNFKDNSVTLMEYLLINMIVVCNPAVHGLSPGGQQVISKERQIYCQILFKQCQISYSKNGPNRLLILLSMVQNIERELYNVRKLYDIVQKCLGDTIFVPKLLNEGCNFTR